MKIFYICGIICVLYIFDFLVCIRLFCFFYIFHFLIKIINSNIFDFFVFGFSLTFFLNKKIRTKVFIYYIFLIRFLENIGIIVIFKEKILESKSIFIILKISRSFCYIILNNLKIFELNYFILTFYIYLVDIISIVSH